MGYTFDSLQDLIIQWGVSKGILTNPDKEQALFKQRHKILEEIGETAGAFLRGDPLKLADGIGDIAVTLILAHYIETGRKLTPNFDLKHVESFNVSLLSINTLQAMGFYTNAMYSLEIYAKNQGFDFVECLRDVYFIISKRTGVMVDGTFIKDEEA